MSFDAEIQASVTPNELNYPAVAAVNGDSSLRETGASSIDLFPAPAISHFMHGPTLRVSTLSFFQQWFPDKKRI